MKLITGAMLSLCAWTVSAETTGVLQIRSKPAGAEISIDHALVGKAPVKQSVSPGEHEVRAEWPDGSAATVVAKVTAGSTATYLVKPDIATAQAPTPQPPSPAMEDLPPPPPPPLVSMPGQHHVTLLPKPIPSPIHPRNRMTPGMSLGAGVYCPDYGTRSVPYGSWCSAQLRVSMDGPFSDMHAALLLGDMVRVGGLVGFEMGTRYVQLGNRHQRLALAIRGSFDLLIARLGHPMPGQFDDGLLGFSNTYGPHFSIALNPRAQLEVRGAVGWTVGGFWSNHEGFKNDPVYGFVAEAWIGMRVAP